MNYKFRCRECKKNYEIDIKMAEYDKEKNNQECPKCHKKLERIIEWQGIAEGSGDGWYGKSGSKVI